MLEKFISDDNNTTSARATPHSDVKSNGMNHMDRNVGTTDDLIEYKIQKISNRLHSRNESRI